MTGPRDKLNKSLEDIKKKERIHSADSIKIMSDTRQLIEANNWQEEYPHLSLYCNWCFHISLSSSIVGYRILERMTDAMLMGLGKMKMPPNVGESPTKYMVDQASDMFSISKLREEFIALYKRIGLPTFLFDIDENWVAFMRNILDELQDKPIQFPEGIGQERIGEKGSRKKAKKIYDRMRQKADNNDKHIVKKVWISWDDTHYAGQFCWNIETFLPITIRGVIRPPEKLETS